uniref:PSI domain-containing protein n=1 Tax=Haptolina ericina TaxID=156174 RepID=A0A7S3AVE3_9EUKA|mmetsp:Transcript_3787/g.8239  ORF Transcript_3787/g.8239 Transcript_3787/m.8239 type:complete len:190 (+) Transcript_3787:32-601(+)
MRALAFVIAATAGRGGARAEDPCANSTTCSDCDAKISLGCSWCQPNAVIYQNGTKGHRCAWTNDPNKWFCLGKRPVAGCEVGYVCSGAPDFQCKLSGVPGEGEPDKHACMDACRPSPKWKCAQEGCAICNSTDRPSECHNHDTCAESCIGPGAELWKCRPDEGQCSKCKKGEFGCEGKVECDGNCSRSA